jgi:hypothetical protein
MRTPSQAVTRGRPRSVLADCPPLVVAPVQVQVSAS